MQALTLKPNKPVQATAGSVTVLCFLAMLIVLPSRVAPDLFRWGERAMNPSRLLASVLAAAVLATGCIPSWTVPRTRPIAALTGKAHSPKPDYALVESTMAGVADLLKLQGWEHYPAGTDYHLPGGRFYHENFSLPPNLGCTTEMGRKSANIRFYEWEQSPRSGVFTATEEQRANVRALADHVESYLRSQLPASYEIHVSFS
jgi:hypothetical protein